MRGVRLGTYVAEPGKDALVIGDETVWPSYSPIVSDAMIAADAYGRAFH